MHKTNQLVAAIAVAAALSAAGCKQAAKQPDDASTSTAVQNRISGDAALSSEPVQASVRNGVVTLNGSVSSEAARALAANDAAQVPGVKTVVNNLTVPSVGQQQAAQQQQPIQQPASAQVTTPPPAPVRTVPVRPSAAPERQKIARNDNRNSRGDRDDSAPVATPAAPVERPTAQVAQTPPPAQPTFRNITVPAGSTIPIRITQTLDSATTQPGENFSGSVATDVVIDGLTAIPQGSPVSGRVDAVQEAAHFKGNSLLTIELTSLSRHGERIPVATEAFSKAGNARGKNTAEKVGGGAAVGAILGGIFGGGKGAAIGAATGGGVGAGANAVTRGQQVQIPSETLIRFRLTNPITVRVNTSADARSDRMDRNQDQTTEPLNQRRPMN